MAAGFLDPTFDGDGRVVQPAGTGGALVVQPDGKVVTAGAIDVVGGSSDFLVARYNADGSPDNSFGAGGVARSDFGGRMDVGRAVALQPDGKIVVAGSSAREFALARYNADGTPDATFDGDGLVTTNFGLNGTALDVAVQSDGRIVAAGSASASPGESTFALARYNADGSLDSSFDGDGRVTTAFGLTAAYGVALGPGGTILAGGTADTHLGDAALARYLPNGSLDPSFGPWPIDDEDPPPPGIVRTVFDGYNEYDDIRDVAVDTDGSIVVAGQIEGRGFTVVRLPADGLDYERFEAVELASGPGGGASRATAATAVAFDAERRVLAAGYTTDAAGQPENFALVRFNANGVWDRTFGFRGASVTDFRTISPAAGATGADPQDAAASVALAPNGAIVVAGSSDGRGAVARYLGAGDSSAPPVGVTADNTLAVIGTLGADDARLHPWSDVVPRFVADLNGSLFLAPRGVGRALVTLLPGDDAVRAVAGFNFPLDLDGGAGNDTLVAGAADDWLRGGDGSDVLDGALGRDILEGGPGVDTADYSSRTAPLVITLDGGADDGAAGESDSVMADVENVRGGSANDHIVGSITTNVLYGNGGNDTLDGGRGSDMLFGGDGNDTFPASEPGTGGSVGSDYYSGGGGFDTVDYSGRTTRLTVRLGLFATSSGAARERDTLRDVEGAVGGLGADRIEGNQHANRLEGGGGNDVLLGRAGNDTLLGGAGDDVLTDSSGTNSLDGGAGIDTLNGVRESTGPVLLEAENATVVGADIQTANPGYTGTGYVDYDAASGEYVEWTFDNAAGAGQRTFTFRYAYGGVNPRPLELRVNGAVVGPVTFTGTGSWSTWRTLTISVNLVAGTNRIRLTSIGSSGPNIDSLTIE